MNTEVVKEIANQLGIAVSAVTKDVIPAYASYVIAAHISKAVIFCSYCYCSFGYSSILHD